MKDLVRWQLVSFLSRGIAMGFGIIQGIFVVRILSVSEYGLVGIVAAVGSIVGVSQHLGLASGSTREISAAKDEQEIFKIFCTSVLIRYCVTIPLAVGLLLLAPYIALSKYSQPELILPLRLYAVVLLFQGIQSILNSVISGMQRFKHLFVYQAAISVVSVGLYIPLVYFYRVDGYFLALLVFNSLASVLLAGIALFPLRGHMQFPSRNELKVLVKELLSISLGIYLVKVIFTLWQRVGQLVLGSVDVTTVGIFSFALFYATKLMAISDAVTDVNLPALSKQYTKDVSEFKRLFRSNFDKVFAFIVLAASSAVYWVPEIVAIAVGSTKYNQSLPLVLPMVFAFVFYSFINIIKSSVIVPAKMIKEMILSYVGLVAITLITYYLANLTFTSVFSMALGMCVGSLSAFVFMVVTSARKLELKFFRLSHVLILIQSLVIAFSGGIENILIKFFVFVVYCMLYFLSLYAADFVTSAHIRYITQKIRLMKGTV